MFYTPNFMNLHTQLLKSCLNPWLVIGFRFGMLKKYGTKWMYFQIKALFRLNIKLLLEWQARGDWKFALRTEDVLHLSWLKAFRTNPLQTFMLVSLTNRI